MERVKGDESILELLMAVSALVAKRVDQYLVQYHSMTLPQYLILTVLHQGQARSMGQLADALNCSRGNLTGVTDRLERDGRVVRERNRQDRRVVELALTDGGNEVTEIQTGLTRELSKFQAVWTPEEVSVLRPALERLLADLTQTTAQPA